MLQLSSRERLLQIADDAGSAGYAGLLGDGQFCMHAVA